MKGIEKDQKKLNDSRWAKRIRLQFKRSLVLLSSRTLAWKRFKARSICSGVKHPIKRFTFTSASVILACFLNSKTSKIDVKSRTIVFISLLWIKFCHKSCFYFDNCPRSCCSLFKSHLTHDKVFTKRKHDGWAGIKVFFCNGRYKKWRAHKWLFL